MVSPWLWMWEGLQPDNRLGRVLLHHHYFYRSKSDTLTQHTHSTLTVKRLTKNKPYKESLILFCFHLKRCQTIPIKFPQRGGVPHQNDRSNDRSTSATVPSPGRDTTVTSHPHLPSSSWAKTSDHDPSALWISSDWGFFILAPSHPISLLVPPLVFAQSHAFCRKVWVL